MYVKKSEYAKTIARNKELEEQNEAQCYVIKNLLKENEEWKNRVKELEWHIDDLSAWRPTKISELFSEDETDLYEDC